MTDEMLDTDYQKTGHFCVKCNEQFESQSGLDRHNFDNHPQVDLNVKETWVEEGPQLKPIPAPATPTPTSPSDYLALKEAYQKKKEKIITTDSGAVFKIRKITPLRFTNAIAMMDKKTMNEVKKMHNTKTGEGIDPNNLSPELVRKLDKVLGKDDNPMTFKHLVICQAVIEPLITPYPDGDGIFILDIDVDDRDAIFTNVTIHSELDELAKKNEISTLTPGLQ